jgi:hypothetical protein
MKHALLNGVPDSPLELSMLGVLTVGLLIGLAAFAFYWRRGKSQREETGKNV